MKINIKRIICFSGILGAGFIIVGSIITALFYHGSKGESYSFLNHFISELGQVGVSPYAAVFNTCLIIGGILLTVFMISLGIYLKKWYAYVAGAAGAWTGISASLVGVFPMNNFDMHVKVALSFFRGGLIAIILFTAAIIIMKGEKISRWLVIPGIVTVSAFAIFLIMPHILGYGQGQSLEVPDIRPEFWLNPFLEWMVFFTVLGWIAAIAIYLLKKKNEIRK